MIILGIETSCDETALALIETRGQGDTFECRVIQSLVHSQAELHSAYGGVFPALAKREHGKNCIPLLQKLLINSKIPTKNTLNDGQVVQSLEGMRADLQSQNIDLWQSLQQAEFLKNIPAIDRIAVTEGPGLEPTLWVGISFARILGALWNIPITPVNHMEGHIVGSLLESDAPHGNWQKLKSLPVPALALLISGGHTELIQVTEDAPKELHYTILGQTKDDAVGEAFDKAARLLGLPYPGGPHISKLAREAREQNISSSVKLPRPMIKSGTMDFSFSGLKTAILYAVREATRQTIGDGKNSMTDEYKKGLSREIEDAISDTLDAKLRFATEKTQARSIIIGGGVSANALLRERFTVTADEYGIPLFLPSQHISGDNALMIALAAALDTKPYSLPLKAHGTKKLGV